MAEEPRFDFSVAWSAVPAKATKRKMKAHVAPLGGGRQPPASLFHRVRILPARKPGSGHLAVRRQLRNLCQGARNGRGGSQRRRLGGWGSCTQTLFGSCRRGDSPDGTSVNRQKSDAAASC